MLSKYTERRCIYENQTTFICPDLLSADVAVTSGKCLRCRCSECSFRESHPTLITCGWTAYNAYGLHLSTSPNIARCGSHIVYTPWYDDTIHHIRNYVVSSDPTYNTDMLVLSASASTAKAKVPLLDNDYFARSGFLHISIVPDGTQSEMEGAKFGFAYAHNTASADLSLSIYVIGLTINLPEDDSVIDTAEVTVTNLY